MTKELKISSFLSFRFAHSGFHFSQPPTADECWSLDSSSTLFNVLKLKGHEWDKLRPAWDQLKYNFESCLPFLVKLFSVARSVFWIWWKIFDRISLFLVGFEANLGFCQEQSLHPKLVPAHMWRCKPQWLRSVENIAKGTTDLRAKSTLQIR